MRYLTFIILAFLTGCSLFGEDDDSINYPPVIYGLGIDINDLDLTHEFEDKLFREYGERLEGSDGNDKLLAHPEFYFTDLSYKVTAVSEGVVEQVVEVKDGDDLLILVQPDDAPKWRIGYEHVDNVMVQEGDRVTIGMDIATVSPYKQGLAKTSLMILHGAESKKKGGITSYCPMILLHESVKDSILSDISAYVQSWEANNGNVYNDHEWVEIGCNFEKMSEYEQQNATLTH